MNRKIKSLIVAGSVFTISTTVGQVISISQLWIIIVVAIPNALAWAYVAYIHYVIKYPGISKQQYKTIDQMLPENSAITHKHVDNLPELMNIWQEDEKEYKDDNIDFDLLRDWWEKNKKGLFIRVKGNQIQGSIGIWSISESFFVDMLNYNKTDRQLRARDIVSDKEEESAIYWYISGWFLRTNEDILHDFLGQAFQSLIKRISNHNAPVNISILPKTMLETILLERLDFKKVSSNKTHKLPVYCYTKPSLDHLKSITSVFLKSEDGIEAFENTEQKDE